MYRTTKVIDELYRTTKVINELYRTTQTEERSVHINSESCNIQLGS